VSYIFQQVGFRGGNTFKCLRRAGNRDRTFITVQTSVVTDLQEQRAVAEINAALDAFAARRTQRFVDTVFEIRILYKGPANGSGRTYLIFSGRGKFFDLRLKITRTEIAIAADRVGLHTLDGRMLKDARMLAFAARRTLVWVKLPDASDGALFEGEHAGKPSCAGRPQAGLQKISPADFIVIRHVMYPLKPAFWTKLAANDILHTQSNPRIYLDQCTHVPHPACGV
jgi:hypothetical protein